MSVNFAPLVTVAPMPQATVFASAARTVTLQSAQQLSLGDSTGITLTLDITAVTGTTPTLVAAIEYLDSASGKWVAVLTSASLTATGTTTMRVHPSIVAAANVAAAVPMPRDWRVNVTIGGTTPSFTFSAGAHFHN